MKLKGKKVLVVGMAKSGMAAARFLKKRGAKVTATDLKTKQEMQQELKDIKDLDIEMVLGEHPEKIFENNDLIVTSPGVPRNLQGFKRAMKKGIPIISEIELAASFISKPLIAVTGTNGKTTVTHLIGEIFKRRYGDKVFVGGNIGNPLTELLLEEQQVEVVVCEVSSFQLEFIHTFRPKVAVMLNISDDHLDRYKDRQEYAEVKAWLFRYQTQKDYAVLNATDPLVNKMSQKTRAQIIWFGDENMRPGIFITGNEMIFIDQKAKQKSMPFHEFKLPGYHNLENLMAAAAAAMAMDIPEEMVTKTAAEFNGLPHRMEFIKEKNGVRYFNDSKGTNVGAVRRALETFNNPVIILMGGLAKGCRFDELKPVMKNHVKAIMAYGNSRNQIKTELGNENTYEIMVTENLEQALKRATEKANPGDVVILSPGCASFDQFKDYKHRGDQFRKMVINL